ncbi:MAG: alanine racemase [Ghiorsea sp.]
MRPVFATIHLGHLAHNYKLLQETVGSTDIIAVVKANAYGHGLNAAAKTLYQEGCTSFAVTDAEEGVQLRSTLTNPACKILLLSGLFDANDALLSIRHHLTPVITKARQLQYLIDAQFQDEVWLKVDTGMNRIGATNLDALIKLVKSSPVQLAGIMSHLACADIPEHPLNRLQFKAFENIQKRHTSTAYSLLNSAGIIANPEAKYDAVRPGIALYGIEPIPSRPLGLKPVMQLTAEVLQVLPIQVGDSVSYGATWTAKEPAHVAVVGLGYGDGLPRLLSNLGEALHHSGHLPIIGRVCMDYCLLAVDSDKVKEGDKVTFFGFKDGAPLAYNVANQCQTITYEIFTGISPRVTREYIRGES